MVLLVIGQYNLKNPLFVVWLVRRGRGEDFKLIWLKLCFVDWLEEFLVTSCKPNCQRNVLLLSIEFRWNFKFEYGVGFGLESTFNKIILHSKVSWGSFKLNGIVNLIIVVFVFFFFLEGFLNRVFLDWSSGKGWCKDLATVLPTVTFGQNILRINM